MRTITVTITQPCKWLATNGRDHWAVKARLTKTWRRKAFAAAIAQRVRPIQGQVHVRATIHKQVKRRWDLDGITPTVKACIDGLADAGVLPGGDHTSVIAQLTLTEGETRRPGAVVLTIEGAQS